MSNNTTTVHKQTTAQNSYLFDLQLQPEGQRLVLSETQTKQLLLECDAGLMMPSFHGLEAECSFQKCVHGEDGQKLSFELEGVRDLVLELEEHPELGALDIRCSFMPERDLLLNRLHVLPAQTMLNFYKCINFRNRHGTERTWPELLLTGKGFETSTASDDWQFAPHPTAIAFEKNEHSLFLAATELSESYGLHLKVAKGIVEHCYLDYGKAENGLHLAAGQKFRSPTIRLFVRRDMDGYQLFETFGQMLIAEHKIPDPAAKQREAWWEAPLYCTWIDQVFEADSMPPMELNEQSAETAHPTRAVFNEAMVRRALDVIEREQLPFKSILLDEGWHIGRGHWQPHPERFGDLRKLVDDIHAQGLKVVVWWNWCEIEKAVEHFVPTEHLISGGKRNRHGNIMRDYSSAITREQYLKPLFHKLFSSDEGCLDLDGVKTDFQADKVHDDMPMENPSWRGEERAFVEMYKLFVGEMKKHKPGAVHIGCAGNYWLADLIDINRTYDVFSSNVKEHEERCRMLMATAPGCPVAYDFHNYLENLEAYLQSADKMGASLQIGNLLKTRKDMFSKPELADEKYYATLRKYLK